MLTYLFLCKIPVFQNETFWWEEWHLFTHLANLLSVSLPRRRLDSPICFCAHSVALTPWALRRPWQWKGQRMSYYYCKNSLATGPQKDLGYPHFKNHSLGKIFSRTEKFYCQLDSSVIIQVHYSTAFSSTNCLFVLHWKEWWKFVISG